MPQETSPPRAKSHNCLKESWKMLSLCYMAMCLLNTSRCITGLGCSKQQESDIATGPTTDHQVYSQLCIFQITQLAFFTLFEIYVYMNVHTQTHTLMQQTNIMNVMLKRKLTRLNSEEHVGSVEVIPRIQPRYIWMKATCPSIHFFFISSCANLSEPLIIHPYSGDITSLACLGPFLPAQWKDPP